MKSTETEMQFQWVEFFEKDKNRTIGVQFL